MNPVAQALRDRSKAFAVNVLKLVKTLPEDAAGQAVARQVAKSGPSVSANYRAACRARSRAEFIAKLGLVVEEADQTEHWLELLLATGISTTEETRALLGEARELRAIFKRSVDTARENHQAARRSQRPSRSEGSTAQP